MPRNTGTNIYIIPPDTEGIPDQTIESATYNTYIHDVETDLNTPRPIIAGGTGANDADEALFNLGGEKSTQLVTNYDTHVWLPGSFRSAGSATAGPVDGHAFAGIVYLNENYLNPPNNANVIVSARDMNDTVVPSRVYVREKKANVWGPWTVIDATTMPFPPGGGLTADTILEAIQELDAEKASIVYVDTKDATLQTNINAKVGKSGDTMTGALMLYADPNSPFMAATKQYVDENIAGLPVEGSSRRNRAINPAMSVSQQNGSAAGSTTGYYPVDMWGFGFVSTATFSVAKVNSVTPYGAPNRIRLTVLTPDATLDTNDYCVISQGIEYRNMSDFLFGTPSAKSFVLRFGWKSPAGVYSVGVSNGGGGSRKFVKNFTIPGGWANTDFEFTMMIPGDTGGAGSWGPNFDNLGMNLSFCVASGSANIEATADETWKSSGLGGFANSNNTNGIAATGTYELYDVRMYLDIDGSIASSGTLPPYQIPDATQELKLCQRYWYTANYTHVLSHGASGNWQIIEAHPVTMVRKQSPSLTLSGVVLSGVASNLIRLGCGTQNLILSYTVTGAGTANATYTVTVNARI